MSFLNWNRTLDICTHSLLYVCLKVHKGRVVQPTKVKVGDVFLPSCHKGTILRGQCVYTAEEKVSGDSRNSTKLWVDVQFPLVVPIRIQSM